MSDRYSKLFSLPEDLYAEGSPVIISAGNLLKDNQTGDVLAQLKIMNISSKVIKAATVLIYPQDSAGRPIACETQKKYLDLSVDTREEFGQKTAIYLPDDSTRGFSVNVTQVIFSDNSVWEGTDSSWNCLPEPISLSKKLGDPELVKQYQIRFGGKCKVTPIEYKDLWLCACGAWNREARCCCCRKEKTTQLALDIDALKEEKEARVSREKAEREAKIAADKAAAEERAKKTKKTLAIAIPTVVVILAILSLVTKVIIPDRNYNKALALFSAERYDEAIAAFESLDGYKDSEVQIITIRAIKEEKERLAAEERAEKARIEAEAKLEAEKAEAYTNALSLFDAGEYESAILEFEKILEYKDSYQMIVESQENLYQQAVSLAIEGKEYEAATAFYKIKEYKDSWKQCFELWGRVTNRETISAGPDFTVGIRNNGTVVAVGSNDYGECDVSGWDNIVAVAAGTFHSVGLKNDGTVVAVGSNDYGECDVSKWTDIVAVSAGLNHSAGIKADGTLVYTGECYNAYDHYDEVVSEWKDIIAVSVGAYNTAALKADGTVVSARFSSGYGNKGKYDVSGWKDIVAISAGQEHIVGLKNDGTVVAVGGNDFGQCNTSKWQDIVAVAAGYTNTYGLKSNGTVVAVGNNQDGQCNVGDLRNVAAISTNCGKRSHLIGLTSNGQVFLKGLAAKDNQVSEMKDIMVP